MWGETLDRLLTPSRNYPPSIDFCSPSFIVFFYAKMIHCRRRNIKVIVTGEPLAFYIKACKGQLLFRFHFAHTIIQLGRPGIFVLIFRIFKLDNFVRIARTAIRPSFRTHKNIVIKIVQGWQLYSTPIQWPIKSWVYHCLKLKGIFYEDIFKIKLMNVKYAENKRQSLGFPVCVFFFCLFFL